MRREERESRLVLFHDTRAFTLSSGWHSIFERLEQHGYKPEIESFGNYKIGVTHKSFFASSKPLTDKGSLSLHEISLTRC